MQKLAIGITFLVSLAVLGAYGWATEPDGKQLVQSRCTVCHSQARIERGLRSKSPEQWRQTVNRMISHGAELSTPEKQAVLDFLANSDSF